MYFRRKNTGAMKSKHSPLIQQGTIWLKRHIILNSQTTDLKGSINAQMEIHIA